MEVLLQLGRFFDLKRETKKQRGIFSIGKNNTTTHDKTKAKKEKKKPQTNFTRNPRTQSKEGMVVAQSKVRVKATLVQHPIHK
jgi:hypothetical protein